MKDPFVDIGKILYTEVIYHMLLPNVRSYFRMEAFEERPLRKYTFDPEVLP